MQQERNRPADLKSDRKGITSLWMSSGHRRGPLTYINETFFLVAVLVVSKTSFAGGIVKLCSYHKCASLNFGKMHVQQNPQSHRLCRWILLRIKHDLLAVRHGLYL